MAAKEKRRETLAGLFVLIGLLLLGVLIIQFGRFGDRFKGQYPLYIEFPDTAGIIKGSEVRLRGAKVGRVATKPELVVSGGISSTVRMEMRIRNDVKIPRDSVFQIASSGLIGDKFIEIKPPEEETGLYYESGDTIMGAGAGGFDAIKSDAESIAENTRKLLENSKETMEKVNSALDSVKRVSDRLDTAMAKVDSEVLSKKNLNSLSKTLANFEATSEEFKNASGDLKPAMDDARRALASIRKAADSAELLIVDARKEIKHIEPALREVPKAVRSISRVATKAEKTMTALQNKNGLLGTMAYDRETGSNAKEFIRNLKRYGVLRYRDDATKNERDPRKKFRGSRR